MRSVVEIRELEPDDADLLLRMSVLMGEAFEDRPTHEDAPPGRDYRARLLARQEFIAVVALHDGDPVGGLVGYELVKYEQERSEIYLYDLAVAEAHRRKGIATALIKELGRVAVSRGAYVIFVQADLEDAPAIALYDRLGAREDVLHFDIRPSDLTPPG